MKIKTTAERLHEIMSIRNLRQADILQLAQPFCQTYKIKLGKSDLSQFVNGKVEPGQWKLTILGLALNVSEAWLMGYDVPMERESTPLPNIKNILPLPKMKKIPIIGTIACGTPILAQENIEDYVEVPETIHADFCLKCKGDSMINARILDGDIVYIRKQPTVENGEIAAVLIDGEATLKRFVHYPQKNMVILKAENPNCEDFVFMKEELNNIRIIGKAVYFTSPVK